MAYKAKPDPYKASHYKCPQCRVPFLYQTHRQWAFKYLLPFYPVRRFFCGECSTKYYVRVEEQHNRK